MTSHLYKYVHLKYRPVNNLYLVTYIAVVGNLLVVLCRSNVAKSLSVPTQPSPPYFYIQQPLKQVNLILYWL